MSMGNGGRNEMSTHKKKTKNKAIHQYGKVFCGKNGGKTKNEIVQNEQKGETFEHGFIR